jgi:hypothetical protein
MDFQPVQHCVMKSQRRFKIHEQAWRWRLLRQPATTLGFWNSEGYFENRGSIPSTHSSRAGQTS